MFNLKFFIPANITKHIWSYPTPVSISWLWSLGFLLGFSYFTQIASGVLLTFYYVPKSEVSFTLVDTISREVFFGWFFQSWHIVGASCVFILLYLHAAKGFYWWSFTRDSLVWVVGSLIFFLSMGAAFLGYVLPWGQMSYWGATVITNLISTIPLVGKHILIWVWGDFSISTVTLARFYSLHYLLPLVGLILSIIHILLLHNLGSTSRIPTLLQTDLTFFYPFFLKKDFLSLSFLILFYTYFIGWFWDYFSDADNFIIANVVSTPPHIVPEWYFLSFYAVLRGIPNKTVGVLLMGYSIIVFLLFFINLRIIMFSANNNFFLKEYVDSQHASLGLTLVLLSFMGAEPVANSTQLINFLFASISLYSWLLAKRIMHDNFYETCFCEFTLNLK